MNKTYLLLIIPLFCFNIIVAQKNAVTIKLLPGVGFADTTSFFALEVGVGYEFKKNRLEFNIQSGSKKRKEYGNGDFADAMITNYTLTYSRLFTKNKLTFTPKLGAGYVSGRWKTTETGYWFDPNYRLESELLTGFGLNYGVGVEYSLLKFLSLTLNYNEALLLTDLSGNRAIAGGVIFKLSKREKD